MCQGEVVQLTAVEGWQPRGIGVLVTTRGPLCNTWKKAWAQRLAVATCTGAWPVTMGTDISALKLNAPCASVVPAVVEANWPPKKTLAGEFGSRPFAVNETVTVPPAEPAFGCRLSCPLQLADTLVGAGPAAGTGVGEDAAGLLGVEPAGCPPAGGSGWLLSTASTRPTKASDGGRFSPSASTVALQRLP